MALPIPHSEQSKLLRLEALRGAAACYVFAGHLVIARLGIQHGWLATLFRFGQEAVMLFFLLSGFVIFYSFSQGREQTFGSYFRRRWLRIYPIFIFAMLVSWILGGARATQTTWIELIGNLFMLQDFSFGKPGVWVDTFCGNSPLWSLSYEWWFYMLFYPIYKFVAPQKQIWVAITVALIGLAVGLVYPNQIARFGLYFIIWWSGAEMARTYLSGRPISLRSQRIPLLALLFFTAAQFWEVAAWKLSGGKLSWGIHPFLEARHFLASLIIMLGGMLWAKWNWRFFNVTLGWFIWLAPISYGLYVLHSPVAISSHWQPAGWHPIAQTLLAVAGAFAAAIFAEIYLQPSVKKLFTLKVTPKPSPLLKPELLNK